MPLTLSDQNISVYLCEEERSREGNRKIKCCKIQTCRVWVLDKYLDKFSVYPKLFQNRLKKKKKNLFQDPHIVHPQTRKNHWIHFWLRCEHKRYDCIYFMFKLKNSRYFKHVIICYVVMSQIIWRKRTLGKSIGGVLQLYWGQAGFTEKMALEQ